MDNFGQRVAYRLEESMSKESDEAYAVATMHMSGAVDEFIRESRVHGVSDVSAADEVLDALHDATDGKITAYIDPDA